MQGPIEVGVTYRGRTLSDDLVEVRTKKVSAAATLKDLEDEYFCYTPALLYLFVDLNGIDPFADFVADYGKQVQPFTIQFDRPVFRGLEKGGDRYWNHTLYFMERTHGAAFVRWMLLNAFYDRDKHTFSRLRYKNIWIADPIFVQRTAVLPERVPLCQIMAFCLETNRGDYYIRPGAHPVADLPHLGRTNTANTETVAFANAIRDYHEDPYAAASPGDVSQRELKKLVAKARKCGPLRIPAAIPIESLPEEKRKELLREIRRYGTTFG